MIRSRKRRVLLISVITVGATTCLQTRPASADGAAGSAAIQAANDVMNSIISDVAEGTTDAAGVVTGLPVHDAALGAEIPELNTSLNEETMAAADGIMTAIYKQMGFPAVTPSTMGTALDGVTSTTPSVTQAIEQLPGAIASAPGSEVYTAETTASTKDAIDYKDGFGPSLNTRESNERDGLVGNALTDLGEAATSEDALTLAKTRANEIKDLAGGMQMSVQATLVTAQSVNNLRRNLDNVVLATLVREQHQNELAADNALDITASRDLLN